jgi:hypothetical protein
MMCYQPCIFHGHPTIYFPKIYFTRPKKYDYVISFVNIEILSNIYRQWRTQDFSGGVQQIQLRIEGRQNGDLGAGGSPLVTVSAQFANELKA